MANGDRRIRVGQSCAADAAAAIAELHAAIAGPEQALVVFFCSSAYDLAAVAAAINRRFAGVPVVGCTTSGEIGPAGYREHGVSGFSLPAGDCVVATASFDRLQEFDGRAGAAGARALASRLDDAAPDLDNRFGLLLIDGLSVREEPVAEAVQTGLGLIPLFGGSAGDDRRYERTWVFHDGAFSTDAAALAVVATRFPVRIFNTQHFVCGEERLVVTAADTATRTVREINGLPAVEEYARLIGRRAGELDAAAFAAAPVVVVIDGTDYVRSIQRANPDGSLTFFSAIEDGLVLRVASRGSLVDNLRQTFAALREEIGPPQLVIACDCVLRNLEASAAKQKDLVAEILAANSAVGFSTYGEQFRGVHVNQTLTGVAIGQAGDGDA